MSAKRARPDITDLDRHIARADQLGLPLCAERFRYLRDRAARPGPLARLAGRLNLKRKASALQRSKSRWS